MTAEGKCIYRGARYYKLSCDPAEELVLIEIGRPAPHKRVLHEPSNAIDTVLASYMEGLPS